MTAEITDCLKTVKQRNLYIETHGTQQNQYLEKNREPGMALFCKKGDKI